MTIRTPRRRISPRTKRKYKTLKNFLRKALGTFSQVNYNTNSSIEISATEIKTKIEGIEQHLNTVGKHCRDLSCLGHRIRNQALNLSACSNLDVQSQTINTKSERKWKNVETKLLYKNSNSHRIEDSDNNSNIQNYGENERMNPGDLGQNLQNHQTKEKRRHESEEYEAIRRQCKSKARYQNYHPALSTSSFHSLVAPKPKQYAEPGFSGQQRRCEEYNSQMRSPKLSRQKRITEQDCRRKHKKYDEKQIKQESYKPKSCELDKDFIEKIINKQYKPVKVFGRRDSEFSQFSAPICRDHEYAIREKIQEGSDMCSCCFDENRKRRHRYIRNNVLSDMRSICDTRLYSSRNHQRHKYRNRYIDDYNNSAYYDVVPVKEKSSPLSRRKFIESNNVSAYQHYKEVPPSPRSHRPKLNLKAQNYAEYVDSLFEEKNQRRLSPIHDQYHEIDVRSVASRTIQNGTAQPHINNLNGTRHFQDFNLIREQINNVNNDTTLNTDVTNISVDKTDKALCEIKDILQSFLVEIKKESIHNNDNSNVTSKLDEKSFNETQESNKVNPSIMPNSSHNCGTHSGHCNMSPFLPSFPNPCCYPVIPVCPMSCVQTGYILPNPSFTCTACGKTCKEIVTTEKDSDQKCEMCNKANSCHETKELIREIYKYVSENPKLPKRIDNNNYNNENNTNNKKHRLDKIILTNRSVGGCSNASKHDANVGTPNLRYCSKSCEAIGSKMNSDTYYSTNTSYSETFLEKLSLQVSQSSTESDVGVVSEKVHRNKFQKLLRSLRLFKKKKKDVTEELTECKSSVVINGKQKPKAPFQQHLTTYAMHGQKFFNPPPIPGNFYPPHSPRYYGYNQTFPTQQLYPEMYSHSQQYANQLNTQCDRTPPTCNPKIHSVNPNCFPYSQVPPQVPLCLKEVEVKSTGTQSQKKVSMFRKFTKKTLSPQQGSQPPSSKLPQSQPNKLTFWESLQDKVKQNPNPDPMDFSLKTQKQLAQGDIKLRNALLKKLFYKRNPFSPRNLIVRTLLGKDKSSYGNPPKMYRPRMFI